MVAVNHLGYALDAGFAAGCLACWPWRCRTRWPRFSLRGAPSTAVTITNLTRFMMDIGEIPFGRDAVGVTGRMPERTTRCRPSSHSPLALVWEPLFETVFGLLALILPTILSSRSHLRWSRRETDGPRDETQSEPQRISFKQVRSADAPLLRRAPKLRRGPTAAVSDQLQRYYAGPAVTSAM